MGNKHNTKQIVKDLFSLSKLLAEVLEREAQTNYRTESVNNSSTDKRSASHSQPHLDQPLSGD